MTDVKPSASCGWDWFSFKWKQRDHLHIVTVNMTSTTDTIPINKPIRSRVKNVDVESTICFDGSYSDTEKSNEFQLRNTTK